MKTIKESGSKAMQEEYKAVKEDNEGNEIRIANNVRELVEGDKQVVCADNKNVEIYKKQRNNGRLPPQDEAD